MKKSRLTKAIENLLHECLVCGKGIKPRMVNDGITNIQLPCFRCNDCQAELDKIMDSGYAQYSAHFEGQK